MGDGGTGGKARVSSVKRPSTVDCDESAAASERSGVNDTRSMDGVLKDEPTS